MCFVQNFGHTKDPYNKVCLPLGLMCIAELVWKCAELYNHRLAGSVGLCAEISSPRSNASSEKYPHTDNHFYLLLAVCFGIVVTLQV